MFMVELKRTNRIGVPTLNTGTKVCDSDIDKVEALNKHFNNVFKKPQSNITLLDDTSPFESIHSLSIDTNDVSSHLKRLSPRKTHAST